MQRLKTPGFFFQTPKFEGGFDYLTESWSLELILTI